MGKGGWEGCTPWPPASALASSHPGVRPALLPQGVPAALARSVPGSSSSVPGVHSCPAPFSAPRPSWLPGGEGIAQWRGGRRSPFELLTLAQPLTSVMAFLAFSSASRLSWAASSTSPLSWAKSTSSFFFWFRRPVFWGESRASAGLQGSARYPILVTSLAHPPPANAVG